MAEQMSLLSGVLASRSASLASEAEWTTRVATWPSSAFELLRQSGLVGSFMKTSPAFCRVTEDGTLEPYSGSWENSGMGSPTGFLTANGSEFPSAAAVSSLSDILETGDVPRRFYLSAKACRGILRRAEKRGKELPEALRLALEAVASQT